MSVASRNLFALLDEDETISTPPTTTAAAPKPPAPAPQKKEQPAKGPSTRGGRYYQRGGGNRSAPRDDAAPTEEAATGGGDRFAEGRPERGRGRGRGRGEGRGRGRGGQGRPDRHSMTGRTDTEKRVNSGWGAEEGRTELNAEESGAADATAAVQDNAADAGNDWGAPAAADSWGAPPAEGEEAPKEGEDKPERRPREEEEEDNTMTLSEYLAKKKASEAVPAKLEGRAANEGTDSNLWKDTVQLQRDEDEDNYFVGKTKAAPKARAKKEEKVIIEIDAKFAPIERGGRGRGGDRGRGGERGRGRGGRGRGGAEQGRPSRSNTAVDVSDESAFPSLS